MASETDNPSRKYSRLMALFCVRQYFTAFYFNNNFIFFHFLWKLKTVGTVTILKMMTTPFNWIGKFSAPRISNILSKTKKPKHCG